MYASSSGLTWLSWYAVHALPTIFSCTEGAVIAAVQEGTYFIESQTQPYQNVTGYAVFPFTDLQNHNDMKPVLGTCFANTTGLDITSDNVLMQRVDDCAQKHTFCCYVANDQVRLV